MFVMYTHFSDPQGAPIKSIPLQSFALINGLSFFTSAERLYWRIFAKLYFGTANNEKATVN